MPEKISKKIVVPVDGSERSLRSLDYLRMIFGPEHDLKITLLYILPTLPPILEDEKGKDQRIAQQLKTVEEKHVKMAEAILSKAKAGLLEKGFKADRLETVYRKKERGVAKDVCNWAESKPVDAIMISTRGRTRIQGFFMGEVSRSVMEYCPEIPIWMLEPTVRKKGVLVCVDSSDNALKAVDHAGFMLSGTDSPVVLFHTKLQLRAFVPSEILKDTPELEEIWKKAEAEQTAPFLARAQKMLLDAGIEKERIRLKIVNGTRSAASDIKRAANRYDCGTIVVGRRGITGFKELFSGSVTRKLLEDISGTAIWIVG